MVNVPIFTLPATVAVEQRHIDAGRAGKCRECPIALAGQETFGTPHVVASSAGLEWCPDWPTGEVFIANLPEEAMTFMRDFDLLRPVAPFSFVLEAA